MLTPSSSLTAAWGSFLFPTHLPKSPTYYLLHGLIYYRTQKNRPLAAIIKGL